MQLYGGSIFLPANNELIIELLFETSKHWIKIERRRFDKQFRTSEKKSSAQPRVIQAKSEFNLSVGKKRSFSDRKSKMKFDL